MAKAFQICAVSTEKVVSCKYSVHELKKGKEVPKKWHNYEKQQQSKSILNKTMANPL